MLTARSTSPDNDVCYDETYAEASTLDPASDPGSACDKGILDMTSTSLRSGLLLLLLVCTVLAWAPPTAARTPGPPQARTTLSLPRGSLRSRPYVVMLDNHPKAYPQTGMNQAVIVFEALAEFGITRYMAVFAPGISAELRTIGPVRSARSYFVEYAKGLRGLYVHAGGSPEALTMAQTAAEIINMDALHRNASTYFRRATDRSSPHNLYTSSADLAAFVAAMGGEKPKLSEIGFLYKTEPPIGQRPAAQTLSYFFIYPEAFVGWSYDRISNSYLYFRQQRPHIDGATGEQLRFKNVIILEVPERPIRGDPKGRIEQDVLGEGPARLFIDGKMISATWRKGAGFAQLRLYAANGSEIRLNPGPTWIAAIPSLENLSVEE